MLPHGRSDRLLAQLGGRVPGKHREEPSFTAAARDDLLRLQDKEYGLDVVDLVKDPGARTIRKVHDPNLTASRPTSIRSAHEKGRPTENC